MLLLFLLLKIWASNGFNIHNSTNKKKEKPDNIEIITVGHEFVKDGIKVAVAN